MTPTIIRPNIERQHPITVSSSRVSSSFWENTDLGNKTSAKCVKWVHLQVSSIPGSAARMRVQPSDDQDPVPSSWNCQYAHFLVSFRSGSSVIGFRWMSITWKKRFILERRKFSNHVRLILVPV